MYNWQFQILNGISPEDDIATSIHQVFLDGFALQKGWSIESIKKAFTRSKILGLLVNLNQEICGYAFYSVPDHPLQGTYLLWEDGICLKKEAQGKKLSSQAWKLACSFFSTRKFGWIGGRTQNPLVIKRYAKLGVLFPFQITYAEGEGKLIMDYLSRYIAEVRDVKHLERDTGICRQVYKEGRLGDYSIQIDGADEYEKLLHAWNFQRENGDALIVVTKLSNTLHQR